MWLKFHGKGNAKYKKNQKKSASSFKRQYAVYQVYKIKFLHHSVIIVPRSQKWLYFYCIFD